MELWDAYDKDFTLIKGITIRRDEVDKIPEGVYHLVCLVLVKHTDGTYLLMRRDPNKKVCPGLWEATAGGSALQGESKLEAAKRELREETGIEGELTEIGRSIGRNTVNIYYLCVTDCSKGSITLQEGETTDYRWVERETLFSMTEDELLGMTMLSFAKEREAHEHQEGT